MENALAQLKTKEEKGEDSDSDKSQLKNESTPPPPQPDAICQNNPLILLDSNTLSRPTSLIPAVQQFPVATVFDMPCHSALRFAISRELS